MPLAESVDGHDDHRRPDADHQARAGAIATILRRRLGTWTTSTCWTGCGQAEDPFQYLARRVPAADARAVVKAVDAQGYAGVTTRRDPLRDYPAGDVAANIVGFLNDQNEPGDGVELIFDKRLTGKDGRATYETAAATGSRSGTTASIPPKPGNDLHADHRPGRAVVRPAGARRRGPRLQRRLRRRGGDGHPHRRAAGPRRLPDLRPQRLHGRRPGRPGLPVAARRLRARVGGEGAHHLRPARRGQGDPAHQDRGAADAALRRPRHPRRRRPRHLAPDPDRRARQVVEHRHRARATGSSSPGSCTATCASSGSASPPTSASTASPPACCRGWRGWRQINQRQHRLRPGLSRQRRADGRRGQHGRQRRRLRRPEPRQGPCRHAPTATWSAPATAQPAPRDQHEGRRADGAR